MDTLLDSGEVAAWLNCSRRHIYRLVALGMPYFRLGTGRRAHYRFSRQAVEEWLKGCCTANAVPLEELARRPSPFDDLFGERKYIGVDRARSARGRRRPAE